MKRVLVTGAANIGKAGVATIVYKWGQHFSDEMVYDYLMQRGKPDPKYTEKIAEKGGIIYTMDEWPASFSRVVKWIAGVIAQNHYDTIHINTDTAFMAAIYICIAKKTGIKNIYVHSHCTQVDDNNPISRRLKTCLHYFFRPYVARNTRAFLACSELAGNWMYGEKRLKREPSRYRLIYNGVEVDDYLYDDKTRSGKRKALGIKDGTYVVGHIGRFSYQKNHEQVLRLFEQFSRKQGDCLLMLIGEGELLQDMRRLSKDLGIEDKVLFLGRRNDVAELLSAMDVMMMPSRFEGLPVTMIEAQMASLPCVVSSAITREAAFTDCVSYVALDNDRGWIEQLERFRHWPRPFDAARLRDSNFNIIKAAAQLEKILGGDA